MRRRICVVTGTRADYGLLFWLMQELKTHPAFDLQVVASAMHLSAQFGETVRFIREDGFAVDAEVPCLEDDDSRLGMGRSFVRGADGFLDAFTRLSPDLVIIVGDRFEAMSAASAATFLHLPIAHIHGGEVTSGAIDDVFRHVVTKMSHLHFAAAEDYARRIVQMGESPERVHVVGAVGLDNFVKLDLPSREDLMKDIGLDEGQRYALFTYHPATMESDIRFEGLEAVLGALDMFSDICVVMTKANSDPGGRRINARLEAFSAQHPERVRLVASLGQRRYLAAMQNAEFVIGNSSSGIIEAPAVDVPTVNVGRRQEGRLVAQSVVPADENTSSIAAAIAEATDPRFRRAIKASHPPYGRPDNASGRIMKVLETVDFKSLLHKTFYDLPRL
jgi:UDP-N-acetylglucosamine 2-epimerase (non-hydrolysing)/GDP/UDP-N,N'-diacetylbacillosamine 2-epimerase (hydrolysing)